MRTYKINNYSKYKKDDLINHINERKKYDDLKVVVFDEAHENYALLL